jgi:hypothetical protein
MNLFSIYNFFGKKIILSLCLVFIFFSQNIYSQSELVPSSHPIYDFLKRMQLTGIINDYNSSMIPISRKEVANFIKRAEGSPLLSKTDRKILEEYKIEFEYDLFGTLKNSATIFKKPDGKSFFGNKVQKYLFSYVDSNASLFLNISGNLMQKSLKSDAGDRSILLGDLGFDVRGSLYGKVGYMLRYNGGQRFTGNKSDAQFASDNDPVLKTNIKFVNGDRYYDYTGGHINYLTNDNWLSLTLGREAISCGFGYLDKLFISNNTAPIDFLKLNLHYKKISYTFTYGSLRGDSLGHPISTKNIAFHRINLQFSDKFKIGYYETVIMSNNPFSFVYFNPISFITSADLNEGAKETKKNNTLMGLDFEINPIRNVAIQGALLVDDINFSSIFKNDTTANDNKFGYQLGTMWAKAFSIPDLSLVLEYTRLNPFVYSHRSNKDSYTNWGMSLGHSLPPNSDEIAVKLLYNLTNRLKVNLLYQFQRSAQGIYYDSINNKVINYGGNINRGDADFRNNYKFLLGDRINRNIFTVNILFEPIKQYILELQYKYLLNNLIYLNKTEKESYFYANLRVAL